LSDQAVSDPRAVYRRLLGYVRPHLGTFLIGVAGMALFAATDAALSYFVTYFVRGTFVQPNAEMLWTVPLGAVSLFLLRGIGDYASNFFPGAVGRLVVMKLREELYARYLRLPVSYYDESSTGTMLSRLTYNTELVAEASTNSITIIIRDSLTIAGLIGMLFWYNWRLAAFVMLLAPLVSLLIGRINKLFSRYSTRIQNSMGDVTRVAKETLDAQRVIKVFGAEAQQQAAFEKVIEHNRHSNMRLVGVRSLSNPVVQQVAAVGLAGVLFLAIRQTLDHSMTVDIFLGFLVAVSMLTAPLRRLVNVLGPLQQGIAAAAGIFEVLDTPIEDAGGTRALTRARGDLEFLNVSFRYRSDKDAVLRDVSFAVPAGRTCAIVGRSGGGKSTLVSLLPRFYDPDSGEVRLDGVSVREYRRVDLRRNVSFVSQDVMLLDDTLRNNIAFGTPGADAQAVEAAAEMAHVMEFARDLPQGLDTVAGERGAQLSGGQRQRIAIARALLKDAPILILDEATSALDTESERRIQAELDALRRNRTTLVIAHRLSTIESADMIVVLDEGRLVEQGTHADLLARNGLYAQLHRLQFNA
jgi:subfamily B ATP-binding cassette protein MsbA